MKTKLHILNAQSWLFIELAIITIVAWAVLDPAVVNLYYRLLPLGYDSGQLLYAETNVGTEIEYDEEGKTLGPYDITEKRQEQMLRQLSNVEGVASVYLYDDNRGSVGYDKLAYTGDTTYVAKVDSIPVPYEVTKYVEKKLSKTQKGLMTLGIMTLMAAVVVGAFWLKKILRL